MNKFNDLNPLKAKKNVTRTSINESQGDCDTYSSKTLVALVKKIKCKKEK